MFKKAFWGAEDYFFKTILSKYCFFLSDTVVYITYCCFYRSTVALFNIQLPISKYSCLHLDTLLKLTVI